jgi:hypothetical protein
MKLITTFPLGHYDIETCDPRVPPEAAEARQNCYAQLQVALLPLWLKAIHI